MKYSLRNLCESRTVRLDGSEHGPACRASLECQDIKYSSKNFCGSRAARLYGPEKDLHDCAAQDGGRCQRLDLAKPWPKQAQNQPSGV